MDNTEDKKKTSEDTTCILCTECSHKFGSICMFWHIQVSPLESACRHFKSFIDD